MSGRNQCGKQRQRLGLVGLLALALGCEAAHDYGVRNGSGGAGPIVLSASAGNVAAAGRTWRWLNPSQGAVSLRAVSGSSSEDVWFVGDEGTVIRWNGTEATKVDIENTEGVSFYSAWAATPDDVWIAGDRGEGTDGVIAHWNGKGWSLDFSVIERRVHSIWGLNANEVYLLTEPWPFGSQAIQGEVQIWNGEKWLAPCQGNQSGCIFCFGEAPGAPRRLASGVPRLRDLWGLDRDHLWVVGDQGALATITPGNCGGAGTLLLHPVAEGSPVDPYSLEIDYVGVWGQANDQVWALFVDRESVEPANRKYRIGVAHWNGQSWWADWKAGSVTYTDDVWRAIPDGPLRRGHLLAGSDAGQVVQVAGFLSTDFPTERFPFPRNWAIGLNAYASGWRGGVPDRGYAGLGTDRAGHLYAVGMFGSAVRWDPALAEAVMPQVWDKGRRMNFRAVAPTSATEAYAIVDVEQGLARWDGTGWSPIALDPVVIGETRVYPRFADVGASGPNDVWAVGGPLVAHFDGSSWNTQPIVPSDDLVSLRAVWVQDRSHAWALDAARAFRWDGERWHVIVVEDSTPATFSAVFGTSPTDAWFIRACCERSLWRWTGTELSWVRELPGGTTTDLWGTSGQDLWLASSPLLHFGTDFTANVELNSDLPVTAVSGTSAGDVWLLGQAPTGSAIRHSDGVDTHTVFHSPALLSAIARAPGGELWAVGEAGATLQLPAPVMPVAVP